MSEVKGTMELDERVFELLSESLYDDKRAFVRELIQNAYDAGATEVKIETSPNKIVVQDNGQGMSYKFMTTDFRKVGKRFKEEGKAGVYGIGRLSCWLVANRVKITSNDGKETTEFDWKTLKDFEARKVMQTVVPRGTKYELFLKKPVERDFLKKYTDEKIFTKINIKIDGEEAGSASEVPAVGFSGQVEDKEGKLKRFKFYFEPEKEDLKVLEKGFVVSKLPWKLGGYVDFQDTVKVLSREGMTVGETDVKDAVFDVFYEQILPKLSKEELERITPKMLVAAYYTGDWCYGSKARSLSKYVVYNGKTIDELKKQHGEKLIYTRNNTLDTKDSRAIERGYYVISVPSYSASYQLASMGLRDIAKVPNEELTRVVVHKEVKDEKQRVALGEAKTILEKAQDAFLKGSKRLRELETARKIDVSIGAVIRQKAERVEEEMHEYKPLRDTIHDERSEKEKQKFKSGLTTMTFGESEDSTITAWSVGDTISLNLNSELVQEALKRGRTDYLLEPIVHEYIHQLGLNHESEAFIPTYNLVLTEMRLDELRKLPVKLKTVKADGRGLNVCKICGEVVPLGQRYWHMREKHKVKSRDYVAGRYFEKGKMPSWEFGKKETIKPPRGVDIV